MKSELIPKYPMYIVSKGRADSRKTVLALEKMNQPFFVAIEPQDYDDYAAVIDPKKLLVLPFSNHGDGPGRARNWVWEHSKANGFARHWVMDDNIERFYRLHRNTKIECNSPAMFRACEDFVDRYENVKIAGLQYSMFAEANAKHKPYIMNTRIYSCLLIDNECEHRWRGRYNEDTDLSLRVLKDGDCTVQFVHLLQGKMVTQALKGGNTDEFYHKENADHIKGNWNAMGGYNKSLMLERMHPDVAKVVWKFSRVHHEVDYSPFRNNMLKLKEGLEIKPKDWNVKLARVTTDPSQ